MNERYSRINHPNHPGLTMLCLRAIEPNRLRIINRQREHRRLRPRHRHEAREKALHRRLHVVDWHAGSCKRCLYDGVVLGVELELHHRAGSSFDRVWRENEGAIFVGDFDDLYIDHAAARTRGRGGRGGGHDDAAGDGHGSGGGAGGAVAVAVLGEGGEGESEESCGGEEMHGECVYGSSGWK